MSQVVHLTHWEKQLLSMWDWNFKVSITDKWTEGSCTMNFPITWQPLFVLSEHHESTCSCYLRKFPSQVWMCVCLWLASLIYMPCSDTQAVAYGKKTKLICCLCWKTNKPTGPSRWHYVWCWWEAMCCINTAAKLELSCGWIGDWILPLAYLTLNKKASFLPACWAFYPTLILPPDFKALKGVCFWQVKVLEAWSSSGSSLRRNVAYAFPMTTLRMPVSVVSASNHKMSLNVLNWLYIKGKVFLNSIMLQISDYTINKYSITVC